MHSRPKQGSSPSDDKRTALSVQNVTISKGQQLPDSVRWTATAQLIACAIMMLVESSYLDSCDADILEDFALFDPMVVRDVKKAPMRCSHSRRQTFVRYVQ